jgi:hypothetical protein
MFDSKSRYRDQPTREFIRADGAPVRHIVPRWIPDPSASTTGTVHRASDADRIDNLAHRYLGVAAAWWMIADASAAMHPDTIGETPGDPVRIPLPGAGKVGG